MVAYPDRGAGNDPEPFFFFFLIILWWGGWLWGSLSQPRLNIFTVGNMRVMICLGQGGLRSLSASSCVCCSVTDTRRSKSQRKFYQLFLLPPQAPHPQPNKISSQSVFNSNVAYKQTNNTTENITLFANQVINK